MKMNVSHANVYKNPKDISANFHYEIFASSEESGKKESQQLSNFANWKDFTCVVQEENHTEGSVLRFSVENKRRIHRRLKLFFFWTGKPQELKDSALSHLMTILSITIPLQNLPWWTTRWITATVWSGDRYIRSLLEGFPAGNKH